MDEDKTAIHDLSIFLMLACVAIVCLIIKMVDYSEKCWLFVIIPLVLFCIIIAILLIILLKEKEPVKGQSFYTLAKYNMLQKDEISRQTKIIVDKSVKKIPSCFFSNNTTLEEIEFHPDKRGIVINELAFYSCTKLDTVKFCGDNICIKNNVFAECNNIKKIIFGGTLEQFKSICSNWKGLPASCTLITSDCPKGKQFSELKAKSTEKTNTSPTRSVSKTM